MADGLRMLPSLASLRSFDAAARYQSFTNAASELNVSQGAISRQIKELEQTLGVSLFRRVGRAVKLTHAGRSLAADLHLNLQDLSNTMARAKLAANDSVPIRLAVLPTFGNRWLMPRLKQFLDQHPIIRMSVATRLRPFDLESEGFDMAIHFGQPDWPGASHTLLCNETMVAVAAPEFVERYALTNLNNLPGAPLLNLASRSKAWTLWFAECQLSYTHQAPQLEFDQFNMIITAARQALGMALLPRYLIEQELDFGTLVELGNTSMKTPNSYYIVRPKGDGSEAVSLFSEWLIDCVPNS